MIDGVTITPLKQFVDERGKVMHMLRSDSEVFKSFGEIYFSSVNPRIVKGWSLHKEMVLNYAVPHGMIKLVLFDSREESPTKGHFQEIVLGEENYNLVTIPPKIWSAFKGISDTPSLVANCSSIPHDPSESIKKDIEDPDIPYSWNDQI